MEQMREHHIEGMKLSKKSYLLDAYFTLEEHIQQLNADLNGSSRESERDMFDQRNQQLQTMILASSVLFTALTTVISQGVLYEPGEFLLMVYSISTSLSFAGLFLCTVLCIETVMHAAGFMYARSQSQVRALRDAILNAENIRKEIPSSDEIASTNIQEHEDRIKQILSKSGDAIQKALYQMAPSDSKYVIKPFHEFWDSDCKFFSDLATFLFYIGGGNLLVAIMVFMWSLYTKYYNSLSGAIFAVISIGISLPLGIYIAIHKRRRAVSKKDGENSLDNSDVELGEEVEV